MKSVFIWVLAVLLTITAAIYQRKTGPTQPRYYNITVNDQSFRIKLERAHITTREAVVKLPVSDTTVKASLFYRVYPSQDDFTRIDFSTQDQEKRAVLPSMPPAGKLEYYIEIESKNEMIGLGKDTPVITRFRGDVPAYILIPHILFMFFAMLFSTATGLFALFGNENYKKYMKFTLVLLFLGGMILGPAVQKFAFGEFWTGFPFGHDLTDNKTLIAFIFWMAAFILNLKKKRGAVVITASIVLLLVFSIPHSMWGSQLDTKTGKVMTGKQ